MKGCIGKDAGITGEMVVLILSLCLTLSEDRTCTASEDVSILKDVGFTRGRMSVVSSLCNNLAILSSAPCVLVGVDGVSIFGS